MRKEIKKSGVKLINYGISKYKLKELEYFCKQYREKKKEAHTSELRRKDIEQIEQTAIEADAELHPYILKSVTDDIPYEYMDVPCGRRQFYEARRIFFILLAKKR